MDIGEWANLASLFSLAVGLISCALLWLPWIRRVALPRVSAVAAWVERHPWLIAAVAPGLSLGLSVLVTINRGLPQPVVHDESSYLLAADTFAHGRITNPTPVMSEHFETPHQLMRPTYMSKYPPGQAVALAVGEVLTGLPIAGVWISTALAVAAIQWMLQGVLPRSWSVLGAVVAASQTYVLEWSQNYWGGCVAVLGSALLLGGWVRLVSSASIKAAIGAAIGLVVLANSRPFEGLLFSLVPVLVLVTNRKLWSVRIAAPTLLLLLLSAGAMGYYNHRITGNALRMPFSEYARQYDIYPKFWFLPARQAPEYRNASQRFVHQEFERIGYAVFRDWRGALTQVRDRYALILTTCLGHSVLLFPFGVGLFLAGGSLPRWLRIASASTAIGLCGETFLQSHYIAPMVPALVLLTMLGWRRIHGWSYRGRRVGSIFALAIAMGCIAGSALAMSRRPYHDPLILDQKMVIDRFPQLQTGRHLILVSYCTLRTQTLCDLVHNLADLDQSRIIWARSLQSDSDERLIAAFPDRQPWLLKVEGKLTLMKLELPAQTSGSGL
jgi:hypothetical protein